MVSSLIGENTNQAATRVAAEAVVVDEVINIRARVDDCVGPDHVEGRL